MTILEIKDKLVNDEINYSEAFELIKKLPKPWHTKDWAKKRDKIIKGECVQCKTTEGIMVAQHLTHPADFKTIRNGIFNSLFIEAMKSANLPKPIITKGIIKEFHNKTTKKKEACPNCKSIRIRWRKTMKPEYFCDKCKVEFDKTVIIKYNEELKTEVLNDKQVANYLMEKKEKEIILDFKQKLYAKHENEIGKKALLINIDLHLKYINLENVVTFCKRCAAKMDLENKLLCWNCKTEYFNYQIYDCCYKCYARNEITKNPFKDMIWKFKEDNNNYS